MNIAMVGTHDITGGAARAMYRLHHGLIKSRENSRVFCLHKASNDPLVEKVVYHNPLLYAYHKIQSETIRAKRTPLSNTLFSMTFPCFDLSNALTNFDIVNVHWITFFQSPELLAKYSCRIPIVITMHDERLYTGGCHYSSGCEEFKKYCTNCPQIETGLQKIPELELRQNKHIFEQVDFSLISPSKWLAKKAKQSPVLSNKSIEVIPNGIDTELFINKNDSHVRDHLKIADDVFVILFGAVSKSEMRKGVHLLEKAIMECFKNPDFLSLYQNKKVAFVCFGGGENSFPFDVVNLGKIDSDEELAKYYSMADVTLLPSLEDNLPNIILESMSCGTPVVGFDIGGVPDLIDHGDDGWLCGMPSSENLSKAIIYLSKNKKQCENMGRVARGKIVSNYTIHHQAKRYMTHFESVKNLHKKPNKSFSPVYYLHDYLVDNNALLRKIDEALKCINKASNCTICVFGAGDVLRGSLPIFLSFHDSIKYVIDENATESEIGNLKIVSPAFIKNEMIKEQKKRLIILVAAVKKETIMKIHKSIEREFSDFDVSVFAPLETAE